MIPLVALDQQRQSLKAIGNLLSIVLSVTLFPGYILQTQAYIVTIDAGVENECFHERVPIGTKLGFSFEVVEGGFYDVDMEIKDPTNVIVHRDERLSNGKFTIEANLDGPYQFCFSNKKASFAPKVVIFDIDRAEPGSKRADNPAATGEPASTGDEAKADDGKDTGKLMSMLDQLLLSTMSARHDVRYLTARDRVHRKVSEKTNSTIAWWCVIELVLLSGVSIAQVLYLKRFFETRHKA